jgi:DNA repair ATPase RecN
MPAARPPGSCSGTSARCWRNWPWAAAASALPSHPAAEEPHPLGAEKLDFLISTNPGAAEQPLARVASGGELSRISLAIQVVSRGP